MNDYYHCAARCGAGAVMGAKKLKAIAVQGTGIITPVRKEEFRAAAEKARRNYLKCEKAIDPFGHEDKPHSDDVRLEVNITGKNFQTGVLPDWNKTRGDKARRK